MLAGGSLLPKLRQQSALITFGSGTSVPSSVVELQIYAWSFVGGWTSCPPLQVVRDYTQSILPTSKKTTPHRDLIEYCMIEWLHDARLQRGVDPLRNVALGVRVDILVLAISTS